MVRGEHEFLRTRPEDVEFHTSRTMFWVRGENIEVAPRGTCQSHLEMAEARGWVEGEDSGDFFRRNMRGFRLELGEEDEIHFYRGVRFGFDEEVIAQAIRMLPKFVEELGLRFETEVFFGPIGGLVNGVEYPIRYEGTVEELIRVTF